jgi:hypothetical protein
VEIVLFFIFAGALAWGVSRLTESSYDDDYDDDDGEYGDYPPDDWKE